MWNLLSTRLHTDPLTDATMKNGIIISKSAFNVSRSLQDYKVQLPQRFSETLTQLNSEDTWIDAGAGTAKALFEFFDQQKAGKEAVHSKLIGISAERPDESLARDDSQDKHDQAVKKLRLHLQNDDPNKVRYMDGRYVEEIPTNEIAFPGSVTLITDVYGPISYSIRLDQVLRKYFSLLKPGGDLFLTLDQDHVLINDPKIGEPLTLNEFVKRYCTGIGVRSGQNGKWNFYRTEDPLFVPPLVLKNLVSSIPPHITYDINSP